MQSMTGYAYCEGKTKQFSFCVEIKTLNSKYNEYFINVPRAIKRQENDLLKIVSESITRGKLELNFEIIEWFDERSFSINKELLKNYYNELNALSKHFDGKTFSIDSLLSLEGVLSKSRLIVEQKTKDEIFKIVKTCLKDLISMRKIEGKSLEKDILSSLKIIETEMSQIKKEASNIAKTNFEKYKKRIQSLAQTDIDPQRLISEVAIIVDRIDINEELVRLSDHISKFKSTVKSIDGVGKKLDFISQEMFREINTIGSKSTDIKILHRVVDMKNAIDKIREQCRNIV